jgi:hypothetical protein
VLGAFGWCPNRAAPRHTFGAVPEVATCRARVIGLQFIFAAKSCHSCGGRIRCRRCGAAAAERVASDGQNQTCHGRSVGRGVVAQHRSALGRHATATTPLAGSSIIIAPWVIGSSPSRARKFPAAPSAILVRVAWRARDRVHRHACSPFDLRAVTSALPT